MKLKDLLFISDDSQIRLFKPIRRYPDSNEVFKKEYGYTKYFEPKKVGLNGNIFLKVEEIAFEDFENHLDAEVIRIIPGTNEYDNSLMTMVAIR